MLIYCSHRARKNNPAEIYRALHGHETLCGAHWMDSTASNEDANVSVYMTVQGFVDYWVKLGHHWVACKSSPSYCLQTFKKTSEILQFVMAADSPGLNVALLYFIHFLLLSFISLIIHWTVAWIWASLSCNHFSSHFCLPMLLLPSTHIPAPASTHRLRLESWFSLLIIPHPSIYRISAGSD